MLKFVFRYEWLNLWRSRFQVAMLGVVAALGLYAIFCGNAQIEAQHRTIEAVRQKEAEEFRGYLAAFTADTSIRTNKQNFEKAALPSFAWHRHGYHAALEPSAFAPLSIGQRDLQPFYYRLTGMSLYYHLFQNEVANPQKLLVGNFDLSFVLVYLFPLVIIALGYGLLSVEKENGVLPLLKVQSVSLRGFLLGKLLFYFLLVTGLATVLSITGFVISDVALPAQLGDALLWLLTVWGYVAFWFALMLVVAALGGNSAFNALLTVGLWLLFLIVIPSVLTLLLTVSHPVDTTRLAGVVRRSSMKDESDEREIKGYIREFLRHHPELPRQDTTFQPYFRAKGYASFTRLNDLRNRAVVDQYTRAVAQRQALAERFNFINPAVSTQNLLNQIARTDLDTYRQYLSAITRFHGQITGFYHGKLFRNEHIHHSDYQQLPRFALPEPDNYLRTTGTGIVGLLLLAGLLFGAGYAGLAGRRL